MPHGMLRKSGRHLPLHEPADSYRYEPFASLGEDEMRKRIRILPLGNHNS